MSLRFTEEEYEAFRLRQNKPVLPVAEPVRKPSKYGNKKVKVGDQVFDSKKEFARHQRLQMMERAGEIRNLRRQVEYILAGPVELDGKKRTVKYVADFVYEKDGSLVVEDTKGYRTDVYKIKRILMKNYHGIEIKET